MIELKSYSSHSDKGPYLQTNEDSVHIDLKNKLYFIFDGLGGSGIGDKVVQELKNNIKKFYGHMKEDPDSTMPFSYSYQYIIEGNALINAMKQAHGLLRKENESKDISSRGGASAIVISQAENLLTFASIGNCVAYLSRKGALRRVCEPDSFEFLGLDSFTRHFQTAPLRAFGLFEDLPLSIKELRPNKGDEVILLTDGAYSRMAQEELEHILQRRRESSREKIEALFELNNSRGNLDNQSAVILQF